jgi:hypothetical protein
MYGSRGRRQDLGGPVVSLPVLAENWQNWQTDRTPRRPVDSCLRPLDPRPIHRWKALGEAVTTVILQGGVLYYNLSYGGYTPKSQLAAINPLFLSVTMIYTYPFDVSQHPVFDAENMQGPTIREHVANVQRGSGSTG